MDQETVSQIDEQRALNEKNLFELWLQYPRLEPEDAAILLELRLSPDAAWSDYGREDTELSIFDLLLHFHRCELIKGLEGSTLTGLVVSGIARPPAVWIDAYQRFPGNKPLPFAPPPVPRSGSQEEATQKPLGPTERDTLLVIIAALCGTPPLGLWQSILDACFDK